ncbi:MAG TPA: hypothetical protein VNQ90_06515 [Chthoniobacteraceae bacterium]|nr:hypothetical protein [Chthoniobacteraceae bacterium]
MRFLWRQWSALGVAGSSGSDDSRLIDPEALLLFSTVVARRDARLFDEILDWLFTNGSWINLQRLLRLQKERQLGDATVLAAMADGLGRASVHAKWKVLSRKTAPKPDHPAPLFPSVPLLGERDKTFLKWGWQRGPVRFRHLSQAPCMDRPATFLIKLRSLFGRQSRAEVICWLLSHESGHPAEIARQLSYFPRSIQMVLNELAFSGHVHAVRAGREKHFAIRHDEWGFLITWKMSPPVAFPHWVQWGGLFQLLRHLYDLLERPDVEAMSPSLQTIEVRRAFNAVPLINTGLPSSLIHPPDKRGVEPFEEWFRNLEAFIG